ncbi:MAG: DUF1178 family protein [Gammaproteobacteria bacterium]
MKVFDLQCEHQHVFEGWFASEDDYLQQLERGLLECPVCASARVGKMLSAPRLNLGRGEEKLPPREGPVPARSVAVAKDLPQGLQAQVLRAMRELVAGTEDVGERFADEARAMHHGDIEQRNIRGRTTPDVAQELIEEGIEILPLPDLPVIKETLQ